MSLSKIIDITIRSVAFFLALTCGIVFLFAGARAALAASLKPSALVTADVFTVGDLFSGLEPHKAAYVLGPSPLPGRELTLDARALMQVAAALELSWRPVSGSDRITIRRDATLVDSDMIERALRDALEARGMESGFSLSFADGNPPTLVLPPDTPPRVSVASLDFDLEKGFFKATLAAPSADQTLAEQTVVGKIRRAVSVPVLKAPLRNGEIIGPADLSWLEMDASRVQHDILLKEENLLGLTPRLSLTPGKPVRDSDVMPPQIVARGDTVTIVYENGPLILSSKGKALENGAKDDTIRVVNIASNRSLEAIVNADGTVRVQ